MINNSRQIVKYYTENEDFMLITVIAIKGSAPCAIGTQMIYHFNAQSGSIGGGHLEHQVCNDAAQILSKQSGAIIKSYNLGVVLGQCCGGLVRILLTPFYVGERVPEISDFLRRNNEQNSEQKNDFVWLTALNQSQSQSQLIRPLIYYQDKLLGADKLSLDDKQRLCAKANYHLMMADDTVELMELNNDTRFCLHTVADSKRLDVALFGAGHISRALLPILTQLPVNVYWIDDRADEFIHYQGSKENVTIMCDDFVDAIDDVPKGAYCLVITYSHASDFAICEKLLNHDDFTYLGLIGSHPKAKRFRQRLLAKGFSALQIDKLTCPIGIKYKTLKLPTAIAVSIAMDMLNFLDNNLINKEQHIAMMKEVY